jgi:hypothetical protein
MASEAAAPRPKKKLPFKPTALRHKLNPTQERQSDEDGEDLFQRRTETFEKFAAEQDRRLKKKQAAQQSMRRSSAAERVAAIEAQYPEDKIVPRRAESPSPGLRSQTAHEDRFRSAITAAWTVAGCANKRRDELITPPPAKRPRVDSESPSHSFKTATSDEKSLLASLPLVTTPVMSRNTRSGFKETVALSGVPLISLLDSDSDEDGVAVPVPTPTRSHKASMAEVLELKPDEVISIEDDDPFEDTREMADAMNDEDDWEKEFIEKARQAQESLMAQQVSTTPGFDSEPNSASTAADESNPKVTIVITSRIPGSCSAVVKIRISQRMKIVRDVWIYKQTANGLSIDDEDPSKIFLTWKGNRLYSTTTLLSLGIKPEKGKSLRSVSGGSVEGFTEKWKQILMEAWTDDLYKEYLEKKEKDRKRSLGELGDEEDEQIMQAAAHEPTPEEKIKVILKGRDDEPVKTTVRLTTTVKDLVLLYRTKRDIPSDMDIVLMFDGERLEEHLTVVEAEISDLDSIDVLVK